MSRILLVEDDTMIASGILYALETEGYDRKAAFPHPFYKNKETANEVQ